ncbi:thioredoxin family protein [Patescibacteria group bacterium]|nr:thioredoxin family protein [Patescibacteria group bacterium]
MAKVKVYSTPSCPYCVTLKEYLKDNNIAFEGVDVSQDKVQLDDMIKKSGQMGVPVVDIDGEIIIGFDKIKIANLLNIKD